MWQLAHCAVTVTWVWLNFVGFQPLVLWQAKQLVAPTGTCVACLPVAPLPLWQPLQLVATPNVLWSTLAPVHAAVDLWQVSHTVCPAWMAVFGLILAWQVEHCVEVLTLLWKRAGVHAA